ncbi:hypothetical protein, partial [Desulfovibrio sp. SGI.169]|uniref:hypothetical protein n=1 Tax=Desulfovibrio sp. SGI.169 TaxID=3420561 RepID=UPI003D091037
LIYTVILSKIGNVLLIDATHLEAHGAAAGPLKKGAFPAVSGAKGGLNSKPMPSAMPPVSRRHSIKTVAQNENHVRHAQGLARNLHTPWPLRRGLPFAICIAAFVALSV